MRIAHVTATFPPYEAGTGRVAYYNALELAHLGHEVTVITADKPGEYPYPDSIHVQRLPALFQFGNAPILPQLMGLRGFDIIHLHYPFISGAELVWVAAQRTGIPYVITHHNDLIGDGLRRHIFDAYSTLTQRAVIGGARKFIAVSLDHAAHCKLTPLFEKRWSDVVEVPNGVNTTIFKPGVPSHLRQEYNIPTDAVVIGFVGGLDRAHHFKGVDRLIRAFARLDLPNIYLLIVGEGDLKPDFESLATICGVADRTIFTGKIPHHALGSAYSAFDLLVLPSSPPESFGMVLIEAAACGKPTLASEIPGVRSVIDPGVTGLLCQHNDPDDLVAQLQLLVQDAALRQRMGTAGYQRVQERYTWTAIAQRLETAYQAAIAN